MSSAAVVAAALRERQSFILTSHARPDGDAIGSQLALAFALDALGKSVRAGRSRSGAGSLPRRSRARDRIEVSRRRDGARRRRRHARVQRLDAAGGRRPRAVLRHQHRPSPRQRDVRRRELVRRRRRPRAARWWPTSSTRSACRGRARSPRTCTSAIATDTGGFRYGPITPRTFEICRRIAETGVDTAALSRQIFDSFGIGRVRLMGAMLSAMELHHDNRLAVLHFDDALLAACGATIDDTEGLVNLPLGAREVVAVALFKRQADGVYRVSLRSKGGVDVRAVARLGRRRPHERRRLHGHGRLRGSRTFVDERRQTELAGRRRSIVPAPR